MPWIILRCEPSREQRVVANLYGIFECYLPLEFRSYRQLVVGQNRIRKIKEIPIYPKHVFIYRQFVKGLTEIIGHKYCLGLVKHPIADIAEGYKSPFVIRDREMSEFQETVSQWRLDVLQAHSKLTAKKLKRPKLHSFEELKLHFDSLAKLEEAA